MRKEALLRHTRRQFTTERGEGWRNKAGKESGSVGVMDGTRQPRPLGAQIEECRWAIVVARVEDRRRQDRRDAQHLRRVTPGGTRLRRRLPDLDYIVRAGDQNGVRGIAADIDVSRIAHWIYARMMTVGNYGHRTMVRAEIQALDRIGAKTIANRRGSGATVRAAGRARVTVAGDESRNLWRCAFVTQCRKSRMRKDGSQWVAS